MEKNKPPQNPFGIKTILEKSVIKISVLCTMIMLYCYFRQDGLRSLVNDHSYEYAIGQSLQYYITTTDILAIIYWLCATIMIAVVIVYDVIILMDIILTNANPFLRYFNPNNQLMIILYKALGTVIIIYYVTVMLLSNLFEGIQYSINIKKIIEKPGFDKYTTTIKAKNYISQVTEMVKSIRISMDRDNIIELLVGLLLIVVYVLLFYKVASKVNSTRSILRKIVFYIFFPVSVLHNLFGLVFGKGYFDEKNKVEIIGFLKRIFHIEREKIGFVVESFVEILFSYYGYIIALMTFSYVYIAVIVYPTIEYKEFSQMYEVDMADGLWGVFVTTCLIMTWYAIANVVICVLEKPEDIFIWTRRVKELHESNRELNLNNIALQNEYDLIVKNDKEWMTLFLHVLGNSSSVLGAHIDKYSNGDFIPYNEIQPEIEELEKILDKCYSLADVLASRELSSDEVVSASFLKEFKDSANIRPYVSEGRISLNMHGLENELLETDPKKVHDIIKSILDNALQYALDNTVIDIDYSKNDEKHILTISNVIDPAKEEEITRRIELIDSFWINRVYPPSREKKIFIGLILAKINAQNMKAEFTYGLENHLRFVARLTL